MKIYAVQTGFVWIKTAQVEGRGHGLARRLVVFTDRDWTDWLPTYSWVIEHRDGVIVVDTDQGTHLLETGKSLHPYLRWEVAFRIEREEEIGPQLRYLGIGPRDVKRVVLTHLHVTARSSSLRVSYAQHADGQAAFAATFQTVGPLGLTQCHLISASRRLTANGDVVAVATPGHTADHSSVVVLDGDDTLFLAGDASYNENLMLKGSVDGVSADENVSGRTLNAIRRFAETRQTVYLPTHDPQSAARLTGRRFVGSSGSKRAP